MSRGLHRINNREQDVELLDSLQRAAMERLDSIAKHVREKSNQSNEHEQPVEPSQSNSTSDAGNGAAATRDIGNRDVKHTSFPCKHCGDHIGNSSLVRKHKYTIRPTIADHIERDYAEYIAATSAKGEDAGSGIRDSVKPRDFKQADAESNNSIERCTGISAGVTI
jgi:hypothetical protein